MLTLFEKLFSYPIFNQHEGDNAFKAVVVLEIVLRVETRWRGLS